MSDRESSRPVGVFDSGIGGLTVVREIRRILPHEDLIYLGDTARVPYGNKSPEAVRRFSEENTRFLLRFGVKVIVVACNTASSVALEHLRFRFPKVPILGVIEPGVRALMRNGVRRIGVIGTRTTIRAGAYQRRILEEYPEAQVFSRPCPLFVPLAEEGLVSGEIPRAVAEMYLRDLREAGVEALILGCTHYPLLRPVITETLGEKVRLIDPARETARVLKTFLEGRGMLKEGTGPGALRVYLTDLSPAYEEMIPRFLGESPDLLAQVQNGGNEDGVGTAVKTAQ